VRSSWVQSWMFALAVGALAGCGMDMPAGGGGPGGAQAMTAQQCEAIASQYATTRAEPDHCDTAMQVCQLDPLLPGRLDLEGCCIPVTPARAELLAPLRAQYVAGGCGNASCDFCRVPNRPPCAADGTSTCN